LVSDDPAASVVKITDFGIAKMAEEEISDAVMKGEDSITASKTAMGALPYMAPEMIEDSKNVTTAADIWALGALAHRIFAGQPPYGYGLKAVTAIVQAATTPRPSIWDRNSQFEPLLTELWNIILDCLAKNPKQRPTADQLAERCAALGYCRVQRSIGTIQSYPARAGNYGFISPADGGEVVFFHGDPFFGNSKPQVGMRVAFAEFPGNPRDRAYPVVPMNTPEG
jgi:serine/threonine-protein kinase